MTEEGETDEEARIRAADRYIIRLWRKEAKDMNVSEVNIEYYTPNGEHAHSSVASVNHDLIVKREYLKVYREIIDADVRDPRPYFTVVRTNNWEHLYKPYAVR